MSVIFAWTLSFCSKIAEDCLLWLYCGVYCLHIHPSTHTSGRTNFIVVGTRIYTQILSTLFKFNQNFFNIFCSCWFSIRHLSFTYKSSISISNDITRIMELNKNFWFTGNDTRILIFYQKQSARSYAHLSTISSLSRIEFKLLRFW